MKDPKPGGLGSESGFTMIEVIVAMLLLAVIAVMLFPAFAASLKTSSQNTTLATAAQLVSQQIDEARSRTATCAALQTYQGETIAPVVDSRNVSLQPKRSSVTCPASYPGVVTINVTVSVTGSASTLATATTYIMVMSSS